MVSCRVNRSSHPEDSRRRHKRRIIGRMTPGCIVESNRPRRDLSSTFLLKRPIPPFSDDFTLFGDLDHRVTWGMRQIAIQVGKQLLDARPGGLRLYFCRRHRLSLLAVVHRSAGSRCARMFETCSLFLSPRPFIVARLSASASVDPRLRSRSRYRQFRQWYRAVRSRRRLEGSWLRLRIRRTREPVPFVDRRFYV